MKKLHTFHPRFQAHYTVYGSCWDRLTPKRERMIVETELFYEKAVQENIAQLKALPEDIGVHFCVVHDRDLKKYINISATTLKKDWFFTRKESRHIHAFYPKDDEHSYESIAKFVNQSLQEVEKIIKSHAENTHYLQHTYPQKIKSLEAEIKELHVANQNFLQDGSSQTVKKPSWFNRLKQFFTKKQSFQKLQTHTPYSIHSGFVGMLNEQYYENQKKPDTPKAQLKE